MKETPNTTTLSSDEVNSTDLTQNVTSSQSSESSSAQLVESGVSQNSDTIPQEITPTSTALIPQTTSAQFDEEGGIVPLSRAQRKRKYEEWLQKQISDIKAFRASRLRLLTWVPFICFALREAADTAMSMDLAKNNAKVLFFVGLGLTFASSIELTGGDGRDNIDTMYAIAKLGQFPYDWPEELVTDDLRDHWPKRLSNAKELAALLLTLPIVPYSIFQEMAEAIYFLIFLPEDLEPILERRFHVNNDALNCASILIGMFSAGAIFATESFSSYYTARILLSDERKNYLSFSSSLNKWTCLIAGLPISVIYSVEAGIAGFISVKRLFDLKNDSPLLYPTGIFASASSILYFGFTGIYAIKELSEFIEYLEKGKLEPLKIISFLMTGALSSYVSLLMRERELAFYDELGDELGINTLDHSAFFEGSSWAVVAATAWIFTATLFGPMDKINNGIYSTLLTLISLLPSIGCDFYASDDNVDEESRQSLLHESDDEISDEEGSQFFYNNNDDEEEENDELNEDQPTGTIAITIPKHSSFSTLPVYNQGLTMFEERLPTQARKAASLDSTPGLRN